MNEYIVTVFTSVSMMADSEDEAGRDAVAYLEGLMLMGKTTVYCVFRVPAAVDHPDPDAGERSPA